MSRSSLSLLALALCAFPSLARGDSYRAFTNFRDVDSTGRYYIVVKKNGGPEDPGAGTPVTFEIAQRREGTSPVAEAEDFLKGSREEVEANPEVKVREGDLVLGKGRLESVPESDLDLLHGSGLRGARRSWLQLRQASER